MQTNNQRYISDYHHYGEHVFPLTSSSYAAALPVPVPIVPSPTNIINNNNTNINNNINNNTTSMSALSSRSCSHTTSDSFYNYVSDDGPLLAIRYIPRSVQSSNSSTTTNSDSNNNNSDSGRRIRKSNDSCKKHENTVSHSQSFDAYEDDEGDDDDDEDDNNNNNSINNNSNINEENRSYHRHYIDEKRETHHSESYYSVWSSIECNRLLSLRNERENNAATANKQQHNNKLLNTVYGFARDHQNNNNNNNNNNNKERKGIQLTSSTNTIITNTNINRVNDRSGPWHRAMSLFFTDRNKKRSGSMVLCDSNKDGPLDSVVYKCMRNRSFPVEQERKKDKTLNWNSSSSDNNNNNKESEYSDKRKNIDSLTQFTLNTCHSNISIPEPLHGYRPFNSQKTTTNTPREYQYQEEYQFQQNCHFKQNDNNVWSFDGYYKPECREIQQSNLSTASMYEPQVRRIPIKTIKTTRIGDSSEIRHGPPFVEKSKSLTTFSVAVTDNVEDVSFHNTKTKNNNNNNNNDKKQYIRDIMQLLFVPESIDAEERDVRRWIRSVNRLRRHGTLWPEAEENTSSNDYLDQTEQNKNKKEENEEEEKLNNAETPVGEENIPTEREAVTQSVFGGVSSSRSSHTNLQLMNVVPTFLEITNTNADEEGRSGGESHLCHWGTSSMQAYAMEMHSLASSTSLRRTGTLNSVISNNNNYYNYNNSNSNNHSRSNSDNMGLAAASTGNCSWSCTPQEKREFSVSSTEDMENDTQQYKQKQRQRGMRNSDKLFATSPTLQNTSGDAREGDGDHNIVGGGNEMRNNYNNNNNNNNGNNSNNSDANRRKSKRDGHILTLKQNLVLLATFMPLALFVGLSVFTSAVAISGLFIFVVVLFLSVLVYRHVVELYSLCFSVNLWPSSSSNRTRANPNNPNNNNNNNDDDGNPNNYNINNGVSCNGSWLLLSPSLLDLTQRIGGRSLYTTTAILYMCTLLSSAILFLSFGFTLTGGGVAAINVLWQRSTFDTVHTLNSPKGCLLGAHLRFVALFPFLTIAVCIAGPAKGRRRFCWWWETGIFRLISLVIFGLYFLTTLAVQLRWTLRRSPGWFDIPLGFIVQHTWDRDVPSMSWLQDTLSFANYWINWKVMAYVMLRLSLSLAQLAWLFACGVSFVKAGTYHLYLLPLLWKRHASGVHLQQRQKYEYDNDNEEEEEEDLNGVSSGSFHSGVFTASGFGTPFRLAFVLFLSVTLVFTFTAFVGTTMYMPSIAAPLPLRLLWTAVPHNTTTTNITTNTTTNSNSSNSNNNSSSNSSDSEQVGICSLGIMEGLQVGTLRFAAVLSFLAGLMFYAWVPYFVVHASSMLANLRPGAQLEERQAFAVSAFLRSKQAAVQTHGVSSNSSNNNSNEDASSHTVLDARSSSVDCISGGNIVIENNKSERKLFSRCRPRWLSLPRWLRSCIPRFNGNNTFKDNNSHTMNRNSKTKSPEKKIVKLGNVVLDISSPFITHPEEYYATTRAGDGIRVLELFKHLRLMTLEGNWLRYHIMEVLLLRIPFLFLVLMATSLLVAGGNARCYGFWALWGSDNANVKSSSLSSSQLPWNVFDNGGNNRSPHCSQFVSVFISDQLYGRMVLFSAMSGGFFLAPLVFILPVILLWRSWWERRRCLRFNSSVARVMCTELNNMHETFGRRQQQNGDVMADMSVGLLENPSTSKLTTLTSSTIRRRERERERGGREISGEMQVDVPVLTEKTPVVLGLSPNAVMGGLAGVRFFVAMQQSDGAIGVIEKRIRYGMMKRAAETSSIAEKMGRHRYPTYNAPLAPSQYYHLLKCKQQERGGRVRRTRTAMICYKCKILIQLVFRVMGEVLSLLVGLLAFVGALRASAALADQYGIWTN